MYTIDVNLTIENLTRNFEFVIDEEKYNKMIEVDNPNSDSYSDALIVGKIKSYEQ